MELSGKQRKPSVYGGWLSFAGPTTQCELVVLGTHGRRGVDRLLMGSDAEQLARIAPVPVMLVRQSQSVIVTATPGQGGTPA